MTERKTGARRAAPSGRRRPFDVADGGGDSDDRDPRRVASRPRRRKAGGRPRRRLFTATVAIAHGRQVMIAFHASVAREPMEIRTILAARLGEGPASIARISEGYDDASFIARTVVTPALRDLIRTVEEAPYGWTAEGFDVQHMQIVGIDL